MNFVKLISLHVSLQTQHNGRIPEDSLINNQDQVISCNMCSDKGAVGIRPSQYSHAGYLGPGCQHTVRNTAYINVPFRKKLAGNREGEVGGREQGIGEWLISGLYLTVCLPGQLGCFTTYMAFFWHNVFAANCLSMDGSRKSGNQCL